jgi:hypothetical protein
METKKPTVLEGVLENSRGGRLSCRKALELAESLGVTPAEVGEAADQLRIKIAACQLGCFQ